VAWLVGGGLGAQVSIGLASRTCGAAAALLLSADSAACPHHASKNRTVRNQHPVRTLPNFGSWRRGRRV